MDGNLAGEAPVDRHVRPAASIWARARQWASLRYQENQLMEQLDAVIMRAGELSLENDRLRKELDASEAQVLRAIADARRLSESREALRAVARASFGVLRAEGTKYGRLCEQIESALKA